MDKHYSEKKFWGKMKKFAKRAGHSVVYTGLLLHFTLKKPDIPVKAKATIVAALGYFILPLDLIPDIAMGAGYVDDFGVLAGALIQVSMYIDEEVKGQAKSKMRDFFGEDFDVSDVDDKL